MVVSGAFDIIGHYNLAGRRVSGGRVEDSLSAHVEEHREGQSASGRRAADLALEPRENALHLRHIAASVLPD